MQNMSTPKWWYYGASRSGANHVHLKIIAVNVGKKYQLGAIYNLDNLQAHPL